MTPFEIIVIWCIVSVPAALAVGRLMRGTR